jgi:dTDP-4-amino-4,6-dideoxygalactose transaminase
MKIPTVARRRLALEGGTPVREVFLPYAAPRLSEVEIAAVAETLRSGWLATGPRTEEFEGRFAAYVGHRHAVGVTSGTAALELALEVSGIGPGDEVITSPLTFVATAHAILRRGATPVFADVDRERWTLDPGAVERRITPRTRAVLPVHFAGRPCDMERLSELTRACGLALISDSAHAIEALRAGRKLATWFGLSAFSFHPVKNLTTGEGGMITTDDREVADRLRPMRLHGIAVDAWNRRDGEGRFAQDVILPGHKCNMSDIQATLGLHQLATLEERLTARARLWRFYDRELSPVHGIVRPAGCTAGDRHAMHMYNVLVDPERIGLTRDEFRAAMHAENVGTGHHYPSLHRTSFYRARLDLEEGDCPNAAYVSDRIVTLPLQPWMTDDDARSVLEAVHKIVEAGS